MSKHRQPAATWTRFLVGHASVGSLLGLGAAALFIASPSLDVISLLRSGDQPGFAVALIGLAFASLAAAAFLATALALAAEGEGSPRRPGKAVPVRVTIPVRRLPPRT